MIIRSLDNLAGTERDVQADNWRSLRLLLESDNMGFSFHITLIKAGTETRMWYKHHLESVFCMAGQGAITDLATGQTHAITPGVMYALDQHDQHILIAKTELTLACVFNPPCTGRERHNAEGAYEIYKGALPLDPSSAA